MEQTKDLSRGGYAMSMILDDVQEDLVRAKQMIESSPQIDRRSAMFLEQALDELAVTKYLYALNTLTDDIDQNS